MITKIFMYKFDIRIQYKYPSYIFLSRFTEFELNLTGICFNTDFDSSLHKSFCQSQSR